jgi:hypothetical protein
MKAAVRCGGVGAVEPEMREGRMVYKCLPGQHDDLGAIIRI